jgi:hypothetical protein
MSERHPSERLLVAVLDGLLSCLAFLEHSPDDVVDPDAAVQALEDAVHPVLLLPAQEQAVLVALLRERAEAETDPGWRAFVAGLPSALGLVEGPTDTRS